MSISKSARTASTFLSDALARLLPTAAMRGAGLCLALAACAGAASAQDVKTTEEEHRDVVALAEQPRARLWDASAETVFLPSAAIRSSSDDVALTEFRAGVGRRFPVNSRLELSGGLRYSLQGVDAPDSARLPDALHSVSISAGAEYRPTDDLTVGVRVSPGVSSDFHAVTRRDLRVPISVNLRYRQSGALTLLGGIIYTGGSRAYPVLPMLGALYAPSEHWTVAVGFPRTGALYRSGRGVEAFAGVESGRGEYRLHDGRVGANVISYRDLRAAAGVEVPVQRAVRVGIAAGYAFSRRFVFYESSRDDLRLGGVPFARVQLKVNW